jgi:transcriptional regulator with XRE-family HTH domain/mannose-6-phosphate isomerase-like protein (cupin superfamily)
VSPQPRSPSSRRRAANDDAPADAAGSGAVPAAEPAPPGSTPASVGARLRTERERQKIGLRELSRRVGVSASLISQIELGKATPSVGTLYSIVQELNMSMDVLFFEASDGQFEEGRARRRERAALVDATSPPDRAQRTPAPSELLASLADGANFPTLVSPLVRTGDRQMIHLGSGVTWERMSLPTDHNVDFLYVTYEVGGASAPEQSLIRHGGREYGHLLEGRLGVTVGFETYELEPGDAISFDSTMPHRLFNAGDVPARAIWFVVGRQDSRMPRQSGE